MTLSSRGLDCAPEKLARVKPDVDMAQRCQGASDSFRRYINTGFQVDRFLLRSCPAPLVRNSTNALNHWQGELCSDVC